MNRKRPIGRQIPALFSVLLIAVTLDSIYSQQDLVESKSVKKEKQIRIAVKKSIELIERSSAIYLKERDCISCHHQAHPVMALSVARQHRFAIDRKNYQQQLQRIQQHLKKNRDRYLTGKGTGGQVDTAGYALWAIDESQQPPGVEITSPITDYLLKRDPKRKYWRRSSDRPPSEASNFATTYLAIRGLKSFHPKPESRAVTSRITQAREWMQQTKPRDTEDRIFQLRGLVAFDELQDEIPVMTKSLLEQQSKDGGWSQKPGSKSDAYATATVLSTLLELRLVKRDSEAVTRGIDFLLSSQKKDGSWHVVSRSIPFQEYFESGFPHGKDQFISMTATCWAVIALARSLPKPTSLPASGSK